LKTYYLSRDALDTRHVIWEQGCRVEEAVTQPEEQCEAGSWIEAKKIFGFPLTPLQEVMMRERERVST
jgi:hypothetical protein